MTSIKIGVGNANSRHLGRAVWLLSMLAILSVMAANWQLAEAARGERTDMLAMLDDQPPATTSGGDYMELICGQGRSDTSSISLAANEIRPGLYPWMVSIVANGSHVCTGVINDYWHIITARSCFANNISIDSYQFFVGEYNQSIEDGEWPVEVEAVTLHGGIEDDIALVRTKRPFKYELTEDGLGSINRLCAVNLDEDWKYMINQTAIVAGWSRTNDGHLPSALMATDVTINECSQDDDLVNPGILCATLNNGQDSFRGELGGPLIVKWPTNQYILLGIVPGSSAEACGNSTELRFVSVSYYREWIDKYFGPLF